MRIEPLSEGSFTVDGTKKFIPLTGNDSPHLKKGSLLVAIQPFLVITRHDVLLLDTGLGLTEAGGPLRLYQNIKMAGFQPDDVTKVLVSHLHKDHAGGLVNPYTGTPCFENASYFIQQREIDYAREIQGPSYAIQDLDILESSGKLVPLHDDAGQINDDICYEVTGAHSRFHQVFLVTDEGETVFYGGDDASQKAALLRKMIAKYDYDGRKAMELRENWHEQGKKEGWKFLFYHDTRLPVYDAGK